MTDIEMMKTFLMKWYRLKFWIKDARQEYADEAAKQKIAYDKAMEEYR